MKKNLILILTLSFCLLLIYGCLESVYVKKTKYQIQQEEGQTELKGDVETAAYFAKQILEENGFSILRNSKSSYGDYREIIGVIDTRTDPRNRAVSSVLTGALGGNTKKIADINRKERRFVIKLRYDEFDKVVPDRIGVLFSGETYGMNAQKEKLNTIETMSIEDRDNVLNVLQKRIEEYYKKNNKILK